MNGYLFAILLLIFPSVEILAQRSTEEWSQSLERFYERELGKLSIPDMEVLVVNADSVLYSYSKGMDSSAQAPYYIGSVSKSLTASALMLLVQAGSVDLDQTLTEILPGLEFEDAEQSPSIRQLLQHSSGIRKIDGFSKLPELAVLEKEGFRIQLAHPPGERHEYSNLNYALLGLVIEKVSGQTFAEFMEQAVFRPLKMAHSSAHPTRKPVGLVPQYQYYFGYPYQTEQADYAPTAVAAGFMMSSAEDLSHYLQLQISGGVFKGQNLLSYQNLALMHTPWDGGKMGYAMGWKKGSWNGKPFLQHLGSTATSYSGIFVIPEDSLGFVILTNTNSLSFTEGLLRGTLQILLGEDAGPVSGSELYLRIAAGLSVLTLLIWVGLNLLKLIRGTKSKRRIELLVNLAGQLILLAAIMLAFPFIAGIPFGSFLQIQPDIGAAILAIMTFPALLNVVRLFFGHKVKAKT